MSRLGREVAELRQKAGKLEEQLGAEVEAHSETRELLEAAEGRTAAVETRYRQLEEETALQVQEVRTTNQQLRKALEAAEAGMAAAARKHTAHQELETLLREGLATAAALRERNQKLEEDIRNFSTVDAVIFRREEQHRQRVEQLLEELGSLLSPGQEQWLQFHQQERVLQEQKDSSGALQQGGRYEPEQHLDRFFPEGEEQ